MCIPHLARLPSRIGNAHRPDPTRSPSCVEIANVNSVRARPHLIGLTALRLEDFRGTSGPVRSGIVLRGSQFLALLYGYQLSRISALRARAQPHKHDNRPKTCDVDETDAGCHARATRTAAKVKSADHGQCTPPTLRPQPHHPFNSSQQTSRSTRH